MLMEIAANCNDAGYSVVPTYQIRCNLHASRQAVNKAIHGLVNKRLLEHSSDSSTWYFKVNNLRENSFIIISEIIYKVETEHLQEIASTKMDPWLGISLNTPATYCELIHRLKSDSSIWAPLIDMIASDFSRETVEKAYEVIEAMFREYILIR